MRSADASNSVSGERGRRPMRRASTRDGLAGYAFMLPAIIGFSVFVVYPMAVAAYTAFTEWSGLSTPKFIGLENFRYLFTQDPIFWQSIRVTFIYVLLTVPVCMVLGLAMAVLLNRELLGIRVFRTVYYLPTIVPSVAAIVLWQFIFKSDFGLLNGILRQLGLQEVGWLTDRRIVLISLAIMRYWAVGSMMIIFLAGLQSVPADLYESAEIDGAGAWRKFIRITLPTISPILFLQLITGTIASFQIFNEAAIMTKGGPNYGSHFLNYDIYINAFNDYKMGRATAEVWVLFVIILIFTTIVFRFSDSYVYYDSDVT